MTEFFLNVPGCKTQLVRTDVERIKSAVNQILSPAVSACDYYTVHNGRATTDTDPVEALHTYHVVFRVLGGKGGFGSMLRSIGAQIEKTTNREACRDLSGRRMRDVNNEKKLREWVAKADEREKAKEERRKERRERMKAPRYRFDDPEYEQQRVTAANMLDDALQQGLQSSSSNGKGKAKAKKRKVESSDEDDDIDLKRARELLGVDINIDSSSSSDSEPTSSSSSSSNSKTCSTSTDQPRAGCSAVSSDEVKHFQHMDTSMEGAGVVDAASLTPTSSEVCVGAGSSVSDADATSEDQSNTNVEPQRSAQEIGESLTLNDYDTPEQLEALGLDVLKVALMCRGVKCGGTLMERAQRLLSIKGLTFDEIPANLRVKPTKQK